MNLALWIGALVTAVCFSIPIGLNLVLLPMWLAIGMGVGCSAARASSWTCPVCRTELAPPKAATPTDLVLRRA